MRLSFHWSIYPIAAVVGGATRPLWLLHDVQKWEDGRFDNMLHLLTDPIDYTYPIYLIGILGTLWLLATNVRIQPSRAIWLALVWAITGMVLASVAAANLPLLQELYNTLQYKRFTPDDWIGTLIGNDNTDPAVYAIVSRGDPSEYSWRRVVLLESVWLCVLAGGAAAALHLCRERPKIAVFSVPAALSLILMVYTVYLAPWSLTISFDDFVGDRILGSVAISWPFLLAWDKSGEVFVYAHVLTMAGFATFWRLKDAATGRA